MAVVALCGCNRTEDATRGNVAEDSIVSADAPAAETSREPRPAPQLTVESGEAFALEPAEARHDSKVIVWKLRGRMVSSMSARLVAFRDGQPVPEVEVPVHCEFFEPQPADGAFEANLIYTILRGDAFGQIGRRLASLQLDFRSGGSRSQTSGRRQCTFDLPNSPPVTGILRNRTSLPRGEGLLIFYDLHAPHEVGRSYGANDLAQLAKVSRDGGFAWGVILEWQAR